MHSKIRKRNLQSVISKNNPKYLQSYAKRKSKLSNNIDLLNYKSEDYTIDPKETIKNTE